jgi:putative oxidoreductase
MRHLISTLRAVHDRFFQLVSLAQSPFLLLVRLYWGWQLAQGGWAKLHNLGQVTDYFTSLNLPFPARMALFIACVEFFGGILFALGLLSRMSALILTINMAMAFVIGDHDALVSVISDPDKFLAAAPYTYLFAFVLVLIFGPGKLCLDTLLRRFAHLSGKQESPEYIT